MKLTSILALSMFFVLLSGCGNKENSKKVSDVSASEISKIENPATQNSQTPRLFSNGKELYFSWISTKDSTDYLYYSVLKDSTWRTAETIISGKDWFTNWADFPVIAENNGNILTSYLQKSSEDTYAYDVKLNFKHSDSTTWIKNTLLHKDGTQTEHGFVSIIPTHEVNPFFVTWLDGRNTKNNEHADHSKGTHGTGGAMTLRAAHIDVNGDVVRSKELDNRVCDCCQTSAAMTTKGPIVVYRDRSEDEIRDISIVRLQENDSWTAPKSIHEDHWKIAGCPVNGPAVDAFGENVAVAWFTGVNDAPKVQLAFSIDSGATFGKPIQINVKETLGRVDVIVLNKNEAIISWMERDKDDIAYVQLTKVSNMNGKGKTVTITKTNGSRATGFPQIAYLNNHIYAAMTIVGDDNESHIETFMIPVAAL